MVRPPSARGSRDCGMGTGAKLTMQFHGQPWADVGASGDAVTDLTPQLSWQSSYQATDPAILIMLNNRSYGATPAHGKAEALTVATALADLEQLFPGITPSFIPGQALPRPLGRGPVGARLLLVPADRRASPPTTVSRHDAEARHPLRRGSHRELHPPRHDERRRRIRSSGRARAHLTRGSRQCVLPLPDDLPAVESRARGPRHPAGARVPVRRGRVGAAGRRPRRRPCGRS